MESTIRKIIPTNLEDTGNSTTTPLGIDGVFTGEWIDTLDYGTAVIGVCADQDSATDGLTIQYSTDGVTVCQDDKFTILANIGKVFSVGMSNRYLRVIYTNGGVAQTSFNLQTILKNSPIKNSSHRINDSIVAEDDAELMKSVITGERDDGIFANATLSNSNRLRVVSQPYTYAVAEGDVSGHQPVRRFGNNPSVGTSIETVSPTSALYTYLTSAEYLQIVSTSTSDDIVGVGMQSIFIQGLDSDYVLRNEVVELDGTTPVYTTTYQYIRLLAAYGQSVGTSSGNVGIITIKNNAGTNTLATIDAGDGRWNAAIFTVPAGKEFYMTNWYGSENSSKGTNVSLWKREFGDGGWQKIRLYTLLDTTFENNLQTPLNFSEKTDIEIRAVAILAGANVACGFYGWMEELED